MMSTTIPAANDSQIMETRRHRTEYIQLRGPKLFFFWKKKASGVIINARIPNTSGYGNLNIFSPNP